MKYANADPSHGGESRHDKTSCQFAYQEGRLICDELEKRQIVRSMRLIVRPQS
jgi:hypothetical protein